MRRRRPGRLPVLAASALLALGLGAAGPAVAGEQEVNVYSYRQPYLVKPLFDAFTAETGVEVNVVYARQGLLERLRREGRNSPADLVLTADVGRLTEVHEAGLTAPVRSPALERNVPPQYRSPEGHWFGLTRRARIIVVAEDLPAADTPDTYEALAEPRYRGRICTRSGKHPYMVALVAAMIAHHGEVPAQAWLEGLKANLARKPQGNDRAQVRAIKEGACTVALINHYYMALMMDDEEQAAWADAVRVVFPNQEGRGAHVNVSGVALTGSAPNRDNAVALMEFLSGEEAQRLYAEQNFEFPVNESVAWSDLLVRHFGRFEADDLALERIAQLRSLATKLVDRVNYDG